MVSRRSLPRWLWFLLVVLVGVVAGVAAIRLGVPEVWAVAFVGFVVGFVVVAWEVVVSRGE
jgi:uncharacterized membrane protein YoaK (UPF0700 family)